MKIKSCCKIFQALVFVFMLILVSCKRELALSPLTVATATVTTKYSRLLAANELSIFNLPGILVREEWANIPGNDILNIPVDQAPSSIGAVNNSEGPLNHALNYGDRISGYILPPLSGNYIFWIAGDDAGELWLSPGADPSGKKKIASFLSWTDYRQWTKFASQQSVPISLEAGKPYYIEILHKQGGGGDHISVRWTLPDNTLEEPIPGIRFTPKPTNNGITGHLSSEEWDNLPGNDISDIPLQTIPGQTAEITSLEGKTNSKFNYGERIRGFIYPPANGNYTFWISGDDAAELWLSTDDNQANKVKIAGLLSWTNAREWDKFSSQKSVPLALQAGRKYYLEVLHKQGGGGDNLSVQWMLPDNSMETPIPGSRFSPFSNSTATEIGYTSSNTIYLDGAHDLTISGKSIVGGTGAAITLANCANIHITQNKLYNSKDVGIHLLNCRNITIDDNYFTNVSSGVYAEQIRDGGIIVNGNQFLNMIGPFPRGQFVQFNNVTGENNSISNNIGENIFGQSYPEDAISLYQSSGTASSPIKIVGNQIRGGGPSLSGGGIMLGDNGGSYLYAAENILVNPGEYGMAIAGGDHNVIVNNRIYGKAQYFTNVGLYVNPVNGQIISNATVADNLVNYFNAANYNNNAWLSPDAAKPTGWDGNHWGAIIDANILPAVIITKH